MGEWHKDCHIAVKSAVLIYCLDIFAGKSAYYGIQYACGPQACRMRCNCCCAGPLYLCAEMIKT